MQVRQILGDETIFYSADLLKFSRYGEEQQRVFLVTGEHFYTLEHTTTNFKMHRRQSFEGVDGFTTSADKSICELIIHVGGEHDERYECQSKENFNNVLGIMTTLMN